MAANERIQLQLIHLPRSGAAIPTFRLTETRCPYFRERWSSSRVVVAHAPSADQYQELMDMGFRRSGDVFYRPECASCAACVPIRVPVAEFRASRSQRRAWRRNTDVDIEFADAHYSDELFELYERYQREIHDGVMAATPGDFREMFFESPIDTLGLYLRLGGRVIGFGIVDVCPLSLSSVYFFYDPELRERRLGVFSALAEIEHCRRLDRPYWYIGFYVEGCAKMEYKRQFKPCELLDVGGCWRRELD